MLLDAGVLLCAVDSTLPRHARARDWLEGVLNGSRRVAVPEQTIGAFLQVSTHPRAQDRPLSAAQAWALVAAWLACDVVWVPPVTGRTVAILGELMGRAAPTGTLVRDAELAALAMEHGLTIYSTDTDFARFGVLWVDPLR